MVGGPAGVARPPRHRLIADPSRLPRRVAPNVEPEERTDGRYLEILIESVASAVRRGCELVAVSFTLMVKT